jgi:hypothetical protein
MQPAMSVDQQGQPRSSGRPVGSQIDFSLYLASVGTREPLGGSEPNEFLREAVRFAEEHDFCAIWLPRQTGALAATVSRVALRAVGGVLPLAAPVPPGVPVWVEAGHDSEDFKAAGRSRARVVAHLLGRSIDSLAQDIALYRRTWAESGHAGAAYVTLTTTTLVGDDDATKQAACTAMKDRLRADVSLLREAAWDFPDFARASEEQGTTLDEFVSSRSAEQLDALLQFAAEQYLATSGLFGGQSRCLALVERLQQIGVDEIGCLIDFGWPASVTLEHLPALNELRLASNPSKTNGTDARVAGTTASAECTSSIGSPTRSPSGAKPPLETGRTETQQKMAELWNRLLDVPEVDLGDNFFDLGGHSLLAARAVSEIDRTFGVSLSVKTLMTSSLSQVATEIDRLAAGRLAVARPNVAQQGTATDSESPNFGRLASWFKNTRNSDRFQDR